ncbi:toll/interleukin-1 receptor domain-containing protein [Tolypothrix sp. FACHB-123]|uniref:toll/interleukin-1 receptor domain-containing protein n=1 Tax=Tolypothrix sp. FACHB-123 TaxID=2692868 RepID=UPI0016848EE3|nr:toll/interleukin-1 receptor domain-containing protein [Tolypothrix sp. FACHB-123]MBD2358881.1 toll/interleukin-1 receptor domain-containing protein [Tolypothrix sp. FACHB-123]
MNDQPEFDVFLAHNSKDKIFVRNIAKKLRRSRLKPWLDEEAILPGQIIQEEIQKVIPRIKAAAFFIGKHGLGRWQKVELRSLYTQCVEKGIIVIPVLLPNVSEFPSELVFLKEHRWVNFVNGSDNKQEWEKFKSAIRQQKQIRKSTKPNKKTTLLNKSQKALTSKQKDINCIKKTESDLISKQSLTTSKTKDSKVSSTINTSLKLPLTSVVRRQKSSQTIASKSISSSGAWVLLDNKLFLTKSVDTQADLSVIIHISPTTPEQEAALRNLQPEQQYYKKQILFAYQNEAATMQVTSVITKSIKGRTTFVITLNPNQQAQGNSMIDMMINGYSADKIAELRARFLLLNELPPTNPNSNDYSMLNSLIKGYDNSEQVEKCVFLDLWMKMKNEPQLFLTHARLAAVYHLKRRRIVEHIFVLKLTLLKNNIISIQFRGQRKLDYSNPEPAVIEIKGNCILKN